MPDNTMGKLENIINKDFKAGAQAMGMTEQAAKEEAYKLLGMVLGKTPHHIIKNGEYDEYVEDMHEHFHEHSQSDHSH